MSNAYIIEVRGTAAGIVAPDRDGFRFHAALHRFVAIDGNLFRNPREAERAAHNLLNGSGRRGAARAAGRQ